MTKKGLLLVNLGTPEKPETPEVRRYLREFLSDPRVMDLPALGRWLLLNLVILPRRPAKSAEAYRKIWTPEGSPLLLNARAHAEAVTARLDASEWEVALGMRYGRPSLEEALAQLDRAHVSEITLLPLYPLNAVSANVTVVARVMELLTQRFDFPPLRVVPPFVQDAGFLAAMEAVARPAIEAAGADHVLFSFHGIPERHVHTQDAQGRHCEAHGCRETLHAENHHCYRAQAYWLTRTLAERLGLGPEAHSIGFQSRMRGTPWMQPYTDHAIPELAKRGVKRLAVICPSFVADCLETLEEIEIRGRDDFVAAGGEALTLVPSLNAHPAWVEATVAMVTAPRQA